jgi:hypothetical protein
MNKIKPFEIVSTRFQVSRESAKYFLGRVQKSFKIEKPSHRLILEFMDGQDFESLPNPFQLAEMMYENRVWVQPMNAEPSEPGGEGDVYF